MSDIKNALLGAAEYIEKHGLQKGWGGPRNGPACVVIAVLRATHDLDEDVQRPALAALAAHLGITDDGDAVVAWSDAPGTTPEQVITALRACAAALPEEAP